MYEPFELPVAYKNEELLFPAQLKPFGYTHRFAVDVYGTEVFFEPDEEQRYRAVIEQGKINKEVNDELLQAIAEAITDVLK